MDFTINPETNDLVLVGGRVSTLSGTDQKAQKIRARLLTRKGKWILDTDFGVDYTGIVWPKATPREVLVAHIKEQILLSCDPGDQITDFSLTYDGKTRTMSLKATVTASDGTTTVVTI